jgi:hypothetical protein
MAVEITVSDVMTFSPNASEDVVEALIAGTIARAARFAPCIKGDDLDEDSVAAAKDVLVGVILRAIEVGAGETTTMMAGSFQQTIDTTKRRVQRFRPDEIRELQAICGITRGGAFTITLGQDEVEDA